MGNGPSDRGCDATHPNLSRHKEFVVLHEGKEGSMTLVSFN